MIEYLFPAIVGLGIVAALARTRRPQRPEIWHIGASYLSPFPAPVGCRPGDPLPPDGDVYIRRDPEGPSVFASAGFVIGLSNEQQQAAARYGWSPPEGLHAPSGALYREAPQP